MNLTDREKRVLELRDAGLPLSIIGKRLGITRQRVWQIELTAKRKILPHTDKPICPACNNLRPRIRMGYLCHCEQCGKEFIYESGVE